METTGLWWAAAAVGAAALMSGGIALWAGLRRRRRHRTLMREAVTRMCTETGVPPIRRLHCELVQVLILQDNEAAQLERTPDAGAIAAVRRVFARNDPVAPVEAVFGPIAPRFVRPPAAEPTEPEPEAGLGEGEQAPRGPGRVPRMADFDGLTRVCAAMHDTVRAQVRLARVIVASVEPVDEVEDAMRKALDEELTDALQAARYGWELARAGQPLAALEQIAGVELRLPEDGIPGRGFRPYLREQAFELTRAILWHRAAIADWCTTAECWEARP